MLLRRQGKDLKICAVELESENHQDMEVGDPITDDLGLVQYHVLLLLVTLLVLEVVIVQGLILLRQNVELTTPSPQVEGMQTTQDHQENPQKSDIVTAVAGHILQVMRMMLTKIKMAMGIRRKLCTSLMKHVHTGGLLHLDELQDHLLDLDLGLLICHPGAADK